MKFLNEITYFVIFEYAKIEDSPRSEVLMSDISKVDAIPENAAF